MISFKKIISTGLVMLWLTALVIILDRYSKIWVLQYLHFHEVLTIFPFFDLTLAYNTGAAFSFLDSASGWQNYFLGGLTITIILIVLGWMARLPARDYCMASALALILGGAVGNLCDRILYGYVIDLLSFHWDSWYFAIFNVADSAICLGAFLMFCCWIAGRK